MISAEYSEFNKNIELKETFASFYRQVYQIIHTAKSNQIIASAISDVTFKARIDYEPPHVTFANSSYQCIEAIGTLHPSSYAGSDYSRADMKSVASQTHIAVLVPIIGSGVVAHRLVVVPNHLLRTSAILIVAAVRIAFAADVAADPVAVVQARGRPVDILWEIRWTVLVRIAVPTSKESK